MNTPIVNNMISNNNNPVPNQFDIMIKGYRFFQSYKTVIAMRDLTGDNCKTYLDVNRWDYSVTTSRYRNKWLGMTTKQIKKAIKDGSIILKDLNK